MIVPVILSGGAGSRLWPLSRALYPKQLLPLCGEETMLQETVARLAGLEDAAPLLCLCNEEHRFLIAEQLRESSARVEAIMLEPFGRNTAPAATIAALHVALRDPSSLMLVMPADHAIGDAAAFRKAVMQGVEAAGEGALVTFGVVPSAPETGYGYIHAGVGGQPQAAVAVRAFVEKPDAATAASYVASGNHFWNSGIFLFRADAWLREVELRVPDMLEACRGALGRSSADLDFIRLDPDAFERSPADSIDYAVMEKTDRAVMVPLDAGWSDVGAWSALWKVQQHDASGNVTRGDVLLHEVRDSYLHATSRLVAAVGLERHIVVETPDAVLVASFDCVQDVKMLVDRLKKTEREEAMLHRKVFRPWGSFETMDLGERFKVKRISVRPGAALSLQMHHHRAEHWIVVSGSARITVGDETLLLGEDQSTYIPVGAKHRLENTGEVPLELIEVQTGGYLGEDDIVRFEDRYGR